MAVSVAAVEAPTGNDFPLVPLQNKVRGMRHVLVLGAGKSSPYLIRYLLEQAVEQDWSVTVADLDPDLAAARVDGHPRGEAIACDVSTVGRLGATIGNAEVVVNLLPPKLQAPVARRCVELHRHMVSPSYATPGVRELSDEAQRRGVCLLMEIGLDPGIDHMSSMSLIDGVHAEGGVVERFESYGSGVPAPDSISNPLRYAITWDPYGVVRAGEAGAHYLRQGRLQAVPRHRVFAQTWPIEIETIGAMEAYPNRDSLAYRETFGLAQAHTLIRGTLRYPGWCETWHQIVRLGLTTERISLPHLAGRSFRDLVEMFLPDDPTGASVEERTAATLGLDPDGVVMDNLRWLGLFSKEPIGADSSNATTALVGLLTRQLTLPPDGRDLIILHHILEARFPEGSGDNSSRRRTLSTLIEYGEPGGITAMARTVGLPAALATQLLLDGALDLSGCHIPTEPRIYKPVLQALVDEGISFNESVIELDRTQHQAVESTAGREVT